MYQFVLAGMNRLRANRSLASSPTGQLVWLLGLLSLVMCSAKNLRAEFGDVLLEIDSRGPSVAISENYVLVGSPFRRVVSVYDLDSGSFVRDLKLDDDPARIGERVVIDGTVALVGARNYGDAYLFDVESGKLLHKLVPDDPRAGQNFGQTLAIDNGIALVGAPRDDELQDLGGAVYVFDVETGIQMDKLVPDVESPRAGLIPLFGSAIAFEDGIAVISEANSEVTADQFAVGGSYVFDIAAGRQLQKLTNPELPSSPDFFGGSVDIDSGRMIVGIGGADDACPGSVPSCLSGAAIILDMESGEVTQRLTIEDGQSFDHFGAFSVLDGDVAIVGGFNGAEHAYFFDVSTGNELMRLPSPGVFAASDGKAVVVGRSTQVIDIASVPEPSSLASLAVATLAAIWFGRQLGRRNDRFFQNHE